jgi:hypothetical protein
LSRSYSDSHKGRGIRERKEDRDLDRSTGSRLRREQEGISSDNT